MKPLLENLHQDQVQQSFIAYKLQLRQFEFKWHYHPEYELTWIIRGSGKRMVGDSYESFTAGDLVLLGPSLPHTWVSDTQTSGILRSVVIQFSEKFIADFFKYPECAGVEKLLARSGRGLKFDLDQIATVTPMIAALPDQNGLQRIFQLLQILNMLSEKKAHTLASTYYQPVKHKAYEGRINSVCGYLQAHSAEKITVSKMAATIHLSNSAFCKFFKVAVGKTFSDYVNELRIGQACQMLSETDKPVAEVASQTGFESLTYFNRVFLAKKKMRPTDFRKINEERYKEA